jgi:fucose permease
MGLYYLLLSSYVALELGVGAWMMEYLQQARGMSVASSSLFLSGFFVLLMLGRLFGAFVVDAVGHHRAVAISLLGSCFCLTVGVFAHASLVIFLPLSGLFMSIVFPTVTASVSAIHRENMGSILGILFAFSGVGGGVGPWMVGVVSDWAGIEIGFASATAFGVIAIAALARLNVRQKVSGTVIG